MPPDRQVADDLEAKVRAGELLPGEQVPSTAKLAGTYGISRGTARRVLATLQGEGYAYITPGWGRSSQSIRHKINDLAYVLRGEA